MRKTKPLISATLIRWIYRVSLLNRGGAGRPAGAFWSSPRNDTIAGELPSNGDLSAPSQAAYGRAFICRSRRRVTSVNPAVPGDPRHVSWPLSAGTDGPRRSRRSQRPVGTSTAVGGGGCGFFSVSAGVPAGGDSDWWPGQPADGD